MKALLLVLAVCLSGILAIAADATAPSQVEVTLTSDGNTWVSITGVLVPTQFKTRVLKLAPGEYEVIGRRKGYWNVRETLTVRRGASVGAMTVICTLTADHWPDGTPKK